MNLYTVKDNLLEVVFVAKGQSKPGSNLDYFAVNGLSERIYAKTNLMGWSISVLFKLSDAFQMQDTESSTLRIILEKTGSAFTRYLEQAKKIASLDFCDRSQSDIAFLDEFRENFRSLYKLKKDPDEGKIRQFFAEVLSNDFQLLPAIYALQDLYFERDVRSFEALTNIKIPFIDFLECEEGKAYHDSLFTNRLSNWFSHLSSAKGKYLVNPKDKIRWKQKIAKYLPRILFIIYKTFAVKFVTVKHAEWMKNISVLTCDFAFKKTKVFKGVIPNHCILLQGSSVFDVPLRVANSTVKISELNLLPVATVIYGDDFGRIGFEEETKGVDEADFHIDPITWVPQLIHYMFKHEVQFEDMKLEFFCLSGTSIKLKCKRQLAEINLIDIERFIWKVSRHNYDVMRQIYHDAAITEFPLGKKLKEISLNKIQIFNKLSLSRHNRNKQFEFLITDVSTFQVSAWLKLPLTKSSQSFIDLWKATGWEQFPGLLFYPAAIDFLEAHNDVLIVDKKAFQANLEHITLL